MILAHINIYINVNTNFEPNPRAIEYMRAYSSSLFVRLPHGVLAQSFLFIKFERRAVLCQVSEGLAALALGMWNCRNCGSEEQNTIFGKRVHLRASWGGD